MPPSPPPLKAAIVAGTRPEAIKLLPVLDAFRKNANLDGRLIASGQHKEMVRSVFDAFGAEPDVALDVMVPGASLSALFARLMSALQEEYDRGRYDLVVVQGDTSTALAAALAAHYSHIALVHIEAGLRTGDKWAPFPEESHRRMIGSLGDFHFAATSQAAAALAHEGIVQNVHVVGNTVVDALLMTRDRVQDSPSRYIEEFAPLDIFGKRYILVTMHRRESFGQGMENICEALRRISARYPECKIVLTVHLNPAVRATVFERLSARDNVLLIEPQSYDRMVWLMMGAWVILTDSGGLQEEAPSLDVPVLVMRDKTERHEGIAAGCARLVGTDTARIEAEITSLWSEPAAHLAMAKSVNPYGDGQASMRIADIIVESLRSDG